MGDPLERFEAMIHKTDREYIARYKRAHRCVSNADALRKIIEEHRKTNGRATEHDLLENTVQ